MADEPKVNPNENCLEGMSCPKCSSFGPFKIGILATAEVNDDGFWVGDIEGDTEWGDESYCGCVECAFYGKVSDFQNNRTLRCHGMIVELARSKDGHGWCGRITDHPWSDDKPDPPFDAIASLILAHACAGIDIESPAYEAGVNDAVTAIANEA